MSGLDRSVRHSKAFRYPEEVNHVDFRTWASGHPEPSLRNGPGGLAFIFFAEMARRSRGETCVGEHTMPDY